MTADLAVRGRGAGVEMNFFPYLLATVATEQKIRVSELKINRHAISS